MTAKQQLIPTRAGLVPSTGTVDLAHFRSFAKYRPKVGDFIIWHGWFRKRWYGVVSNINGDELLVIKENLPKLLFTLSPSEFKSNTIMVSLTNIQTSRGGEFCVIQDGIYYVDE